MFVDVLPDPAAGQRQGKVSFYLDPGFGYGGKIEKAAVRSMLQDLSRFTDLGEAVRSRKARRRTRTGSTTGSAFFHPFTVDDILIKPTWEKVPASAAGKTVIQIDPGTAFGTGSHETTQLCIRQLEKYIKIMKEAGAGEHIEVLDVGTGSGILGIAALKLGACHVFATDLG
jgi:ribosomal protein L11 methyltransferase